MAMAVDYAPGVVLSAIVAAIGYVAAPYVAHVAPIPNMVIALELAFVHRVRKAEGKDGNPLNEVRLIAFSLLEHDGVMTEDPTIKYDTRKSITGLAIGDQIIIDREAFERLAAGFYGEIERKYP